MVLFLLHIGLDDTDSRMGGCTTYLAALLVERINALGLTFIDYPNLVRLNPNVPWKTRGNGAVALRVDGPTHLLQDAKAAALDILESNASLDSEGTDPAVVFLEGAVSTSLRDFSRTALTDVMSPQSALRLVKNVGAEAVCYGDRRGMVGALAAVGELLSGDHTFELIAYRVPGSRGRPRLIDEASARSMDEATRGETFNNLDPETGRLLITPRGPDPILYGIRGESPAGVYRAHLMLKVGEPVERWMIFRTNHGTDSHLQGMVKVAEAGAYRSVVVQGLVSQPPRRMKGGHVVFAVKDESGEIQCAAYEPTGRFRDVAAALAVGDEVRVFGGVRRASRTQPRTVNLEKLEVLKLVTVGAYTAPVCPKCGRRMKSEGRGKGYGCAHCGFRDRKAQKAFTPSQRKIRLGLYVPPPRANRHLTKPLSRYGLEKPYAATKLFEPWHWP
ncbi:MAG: tRNA(Ile)(2)-agmatinylcytidine synthase [Candidatus Bathyarchaeia archaeon]